MNVESALQIFVEEAAGLLQDMEGALLALEHRPGDADLIAELFRAAHTIKGSGGLFGLDAIVSFTHVLESLLERLRRQELCASEAMTGTLLACCDHLASLVETTAARGQAISAEQAAVSAALLAQLQPYLDGLAGPAPAPAGTAAATDADAADPVPDDWHISVQFGADVLRDGMDPMLIIHYLGTLGQIVALQTRYDAMPTLAAMDAETCYLGFEIDLRSGADKQSIDEVFDFVRDNISLRIVPPPSHLARYMDQIGALTGDLSRLGEILLEAGVLTSAELAQALAQQQPLAEHDGAAPMLGQILVETGVVRPELLGLALEKQQQLRDTRGQEARSIRVNADKLDELINRVGELVIAGASAALAARGVKHRALLEATAVINRLIEEIRDDAMRLRMVEIGDTFQRFQRVVRDMNKEIGKDIALSISGAETELDKMVVEKISDPLTHLVRNAMDHGIEPAALRLARGKPERGQLSLRARHDSGSILIEVADDGGGLDRERILAKALERGLIASADGLSERDIFKLVFEPGFSTAAQLTNLSGRGVGMDVVKRNIEALRGSVDIDSVAGAGTTVRIRLPLTLAIIDGFLIGVGGASYVVPLNMVLECVEISAADRLAENEHSYINLRGEVLPYLRLREHFGIGGQASRRESIVVVQHGGRKAGLAVDELLGEFQTVIKPLNKMFAGVPAVSGSTILGSGAVALILDVPALVQQAASHDAALCRA